MGRAKETAKIQNRAALRQYNYDLKAFAAQKADLQREVDLTNKISSDTFKYQQEIRNLERISVMEQYEKAEDQYKQQLVWNDQAAQAALDSQDRVYNQRVSELKETFENQQVQMDRTNQTAGYNLDMAEFTLEQALYQKNASLRQIDLDSRSQQLSINAEKSDIIKAKNQLAIRKIQIENQERDAEADRNFDQFEADINLIQAQGQELARGRSGASASNAIQSSLAAFAFNTAKIDDALYRSQESLDLERKNIRVDRRDLKRQKNNLSSRQDLVKDAKRTAKFEAKKSFTFQQKKAEFDIQKIADELEIDLAVFTQNQAKLGASLVNAAEEREFAIKEITRGKVQADLQTDATRMLPPKFAPDPPRPYKAEMPTLVPPPEPIQVKREAFQVQQPKKQSGTSKILAIGAAVLGVAGAAFTGGASLFGAGAALGGLGIGVGTATAIGVGATAASGGLGLISKYTY